MRRTWEQELAGCTHELGCGGSKRKGLPGSPRLELFTEMGNEKNKGGVGLRNPLGPGETGRNVRQAGTSQGSEELSGQKSQM